MRKSQVVTEFVQEGKFRHFKIIRISRKGEYFFENSNQGKKKIYPNFKLCGVKGF